MTPEISSLPTNRSAFVQRYTYPSPTESPPVLFQVTPLINIAKIFALRVHVLAHLRILRQLRHGHDVVQQGRRALPVLLRPIVRQRPVFDVLLLPEPPQPVDIGMVKEEQGI